MRTALALLLSSTLAHAEGPAPARPGELAIEVRAQGLPERTRVALRIVGPGGRAVWRCSYTSPSLSLEAVDIPPRCAHGHARLLAGGLHRVSARLEAGRMGGVALEERVLLDGHEHRLIVELPSLMAGTPGARSTGSMAGPSLGLRRVVAAPEALRLTRAWRPTPTEPARYLLVNGHHHEVYGMGAGGQFVGNIERLVDGRWQLWRQGPGVQNGPAGALQPGQRTDATDGVRMSPRALSPGRYRFVIDVSEAQPWPPPATLYELTDEFTIE